MNIEGAASRCRSIRVNQGRQERGNGGGGGGQAGEESGYWKSLALRAERLLVEAQCEAGVWREAEKRGKRGGGGKGEVSATATRITGAVALIMKFVPAA